MIVKHVTIKDYLFKSEDNPYSFEAKPRKSLDKIAQNIESVILSAVGKKHVLIRGIQSGHHSGINRDHLVKLIKQNGTDMLKIHDDQDVIYAALLEAGTIKKILDGFHTYKPKSERIPQYPVDIWMIFDLDAYDNIEYLHPRHKVTARDKWKLKVSSKSGLVAILTVN